MIYIVPMPLVNAACGKTPDLVTLLTEVDNWDQKHRLLYDSLMRKEKVDSTFLALLDHQILHDDSINRSIIDSLISMKGYVGLSMVGKELMDVVFNVVLHAPLEYLLKYTEVIRKAADECEFNFSYYPYLIDRNLLDQGEDQKFGTQFQFDQANRKFVPFPIEDMEVVDSLRKTYFMPKLNTYIEYMNQ